MSLNKVTFPVTVSAKMFVMCAASIGFSLKCVHALWNFFCVKERKYSRVHKIIFFPDKTVACRNQFTKRHGCTSPVCKFSHDDELSYAQLMKALGSTKFSVDICVFCITSDELAIILCELNEKGVAVRIITDSEQVNASGSKIGLFRKEGIPVRCDDTTFYMHHKFALIDEELLINGSFNWTRAAITGNFENLSLTNDPNFVHPYRTEFQNLWEKFDPKRIQFPQS